MVLLPALPAPAGDDRDRRLKELEERLGQKSDEEIRDLRERLRRLKGKPTQEKEGLRRKIEKAHRIARRLFGDLPEEDRERVRRLPAERREALARYAVDLLAEAVRKQLFASLSDRERERLRRLGAPERARAIFQIKKVQVLDRLGREERAALDRLPGPERMERIGRMLRRAHEAELAKARRRVLDQVRRMLDWPRDRFESELRRPWVVRKLRRPGLERLAPRILRLPPREIRRRMAELDDALRRPDPRERRAALAAWQAKIPE